MPEMKTLLESFIDESLESFTPTTKKGLPRNQSVGLQTKKKYEIALRLAVTSATPKELAAKFGMTAQAVRLYSCQ